MKSSVLTGCCNRWCLSCNSSLAMLATKDTSRGADNKSDDSNGDYNNNSNNNLHTQVLPPVFPGHFTRRLLEGICLQKQRYTQQL